MSITESAADHETRQPDRATGSGGRTGTDGMTITGRLPEFGLVAADLYRDIHKAIRAELFSLAGTAGGLDPSDPDGRAALADHVRSVVEQLTSHAEHEDRVIQPVVEQHLPALAEIIAVDHHSLEERMDGLLEMAAAAVVAPRAELRARVHHLYLELSSFTGAYLHHQDVEERVVMPGLEAAVGVDAVLEMHEAIVSSIPPEEMARSLAVMLPAMNVEDRVEMLGRMRAAAPAEAFDAVWRLAGSVLTVPDRIAVATRLSIV